MEKEDTLDFFRRQEDELRAFGVQSLFLFGSTVRGDSKADSDIDLFIDYDENGGFSLLDLIAVKHFIEDELQVSVDVMSRRSPHPVLSDRILAEAERVF